MKKCKDCFEKIHGNGVYCKNCLNLPKNSTRLCPLCSKELTYSLRANMLKAEENKKVCSKCSMKIRDYSGKNNPFYGKNHTEELKQEFSKVRKDWYKGVKNPKKGHKGNKNPMYGITVYQKWLEKYGKVIADEKLQKFKDKISIKNKGSNNPMFNKVPGIGAGNGISGWYKKWFFRSLHELSYMIYVIERFNINWKSAEKKKYSIKYFNEEGESRNYFADFILNDKYIVEVKPKALRNTKLNKLKFKAADNYFNDLKFKVVSSPKVIIKKDLLKLIENKQVKLIKRWENIIKP